MTTLRSFALLLFALCLLPACGPDDDDGGSVTQGADPADVEGLNFTVVPGGDPATILGIVRDSIEANDDIGFNLLVDHAAAADRPLPPTLLLYFNRPSLTSPLLTTDQRAGLSLPLSILAYRDGADAIVAYNNAAYFGNRYGTERVPSLTGVGETLSGLVVGATGGAIRGLPANNVALGGGVEGETSGRSFSQVLASVRSAIASEGTFTILAEIDHAASAASVGFELRPTVLFLLSNPALAGTLIDAGPTAAVDLPQRLLVYQTESGSVRIVYNDPSWVAGRHGLTTVNDQLRTVRDALATIAEEGAN